MESNQELNESITVKDLVRLLSKTTVWASLGGTFKTADFENIKMDFGIAGIPIEITDEELSKRLQMSKMTLSKVVDGLADEMSRRLKEDLGR